MGHNTKLAAVRDEYAVVLVDGLIVGHVAMSTTRQATRDGFSTHQEWHYYYRSNPVPPPAPGSGQALPDDAKIKSSTRYATRDDAVEELVSVSTAPKPCRKCDGRGILPSEGTPIRCDRCRGTRREG